MRLGLRYSRIGAGSARGVVISGAHQRTRDDFKSHFFAPLAAGASTLFILESTKTKKAHAKDNSERIFTLEEVKSHNTAESIWVTFEGHVYDVTDWARSHPGGAANLLLAAGKDLAPFWNIYQQHNTEMVRGILAEYKIGKLEKQPDSEKGPDLENPYWNEPERHPAIKVNKLAPFNGEPPPSLLTREFITPNDLHFIRNRLPVPDIKLEEFEFTLQLGIKSVKYSLEELKSKFEVVETPITLMCGGNRRQEFKSRVLDKKVNGLSWDQCAISTSRWKGIYVCDLLEAHGITHKWARENNFNHLWAEGSDEGPDGVGTGSSIPLSRALDRSAGVMLAFEMNGEPIPRDHGFPLRFLIPGTVGARNIKWLRKLELSEVESYSPTQRKDYKVFGPNVTDPKTIPWESTPSVQYLPVTSAFLQPSGDTVAECGETVSLSGYAFSGGGNGIIRVDISIDGGKNWAQAEIKNENDPFSQRSFAWTLWNFEFETPEEECEMEICVRATDSNCNTQPENISHLWNVRGLLNNSWHRIKIKVSKNED